MSSAKQDAEQLLDSALPLAESLLKEHGEFFPYGAAMKPDGQIVSIAADNGEENPPSQSVIDILRSTFKIAASKQEYIATAIIYDVLTIPPKRETKTDAIAVALDHRDQYSVVVFFPYKIADGKVELEPPFATEGSAEIFE